MLSAVTISATSTHENGPNVETIRSSDPAAATRCSGPSTRHARAYSEILAPGETCIGLVPVGDLVLAFLPAEVDLTTVAQRGEVHQPALEVADDHLDGVELARSRLQLEERLGHDLARLAASVTRGRLAEGLARVLVGEAVPTRAQSLDSLGHPRQRGVGLFQRVVAVVLQASCSRRRSMRSRMRWSRSPSAATRRASSNASRALSSERPCFSRLSPRRSSVRTRSAGSESVTVATLAGLPWSDVG